MLDSDGRGRYKAAPSQRGDASDGLVDYLVIIETRHMGLTETLGTRMRVAAAVAAICTYSEANG